MHLEIYQNLQQFCLHWDLGNPPSDIIPGSGYHRAGTRVFFPGLVFIGRDTFTHQHPHTHTKTTKASEKLLLGNKFIIFTGHQSKKKTTKQNKTKQTKIFSNCLLCPRIDIIFENLLRYCKKLWRNISKNVQYKTHVLMLK